MFVFFKQKTAYEMRISDWSSDVCSSDLAPTPPFFTLEGPQAGRQVGRQAAFGQVPLERQGPRRGARAVARTLNGGGGEACAVAHRTAAHEPVAPRLSGPPPSRRAFKRPALTETREGRGRIVRRYRIFPFARKSTRLNSSHQCASRMPSSA